MFNATYFTYDGVLSAKYKLKIASFDDDPVAETNIFSQEITTAKALHQNKYYISSIDYSGAPEYEVSVISAVVINEQDKRNILDWLCRGKDFKKLIIHRPEVESYYYMCKFKSVSEISVNGYCVGFKMTAVFDSPYQYGIPTTLELTSGNYQEKEFTIVNKSDFSDEYIYPVIKFRLNNTGAISIINTTDDEDRVFEISDVSAGNEITVDNDLKIISGDSAYLSNFSNKWLRLKKGENKLKITLDGELSITCPEVVHICF